MNRRLAHPARLVAAFALAAAAWPAVAAAQAASPAERLYAERVAMQALAARCRLLAPGPSQALAAFAAQARGALLRAGTDTARLDLIAGQARGGVARLSCGAPSVRAETARLISAHRAWAAQTGASYPGAARAWTASRAGVDAWRAWQDVGAGVRAGLVATEAGLVFALEAPAGDVAGARVLLRDAARAGPPRAGARLETAHRGATRTLLAAGRGPAISRVRVSADPRAGSLLTFAPDGTRAIVAADPRDSFEVEMVGRDGRVSRHVVEVGDLAAAYAFASAT